MGADINSLKAAKIFVELLADFQEEMNHTFKTLRIIPTMVEPNKLSQTILARYRVQYGDLCTAASIRRAVAVQEANVLGKSLMEVGSNSAVFQDFVGVMKEINADLMDNPAPFRSTAKFPRELERNEIANCMREKIMAIDEKHLGDLSPEDSAVERLRKRNRRIRPWESSLMGGIFQELNGPTRG